MKRKIAAIFAADIAGYSRLVAEDEEETLRRLASYRQVTDDFIAKGGGRIFNTAGDAVLAEFPSAVEAVRCAIDIQESLRTRNMAYPPSRQMSFRIGITIGDVVERDGDLLGDGVNIAARLEGLAEVGGICVSRAVHEQVANKLSVQFADIGAQEVKNIPTPVHAYMVAMRREDGTYATPQVKKPAKAQARRAGLDVAGRGHAWLVRGDRRRRLSLFHQARDDAGGTGPSPRAPRARRRRLRRPGGRSCACLVAAGTCRRRRQPHRTAASCGCAADRHRRRRSSRARNFRRRRCRSSATTHARVAHQRVSAGGGPQGHRFQHRRHSTALSSASRAKKQRRRRGRAVPEARRCSSIAAQMRVLRGRRYRRLSARQAADAAIALDPARSVDRAAVRRQGGADDPRPAARRGSKTPIRPARKPRPLRSARAASSSSPPTWRRSTTRRGAI